MNLSHDSPDCTGVWDARITAGVMFWKCSECGAIGSDCMANHEAAIGENLAGNTLDQLTREGQKLLEGA